MVVADRRCRSGGEDAVPSQQDRRERTLGSRNITVNSTFLSLQEGRDYTCQVQPLIVLFSFVRGIETLAYPVEEVRTRKQMTVISEWKSGYLQ